MQNRSTSFAYQPALDGLRALAVLAVVAYHFGAGWAQGGFLGVDLFFVLSGFLITSLLLRERDDNGKIHLPGFWTRRARRLLPAVFLLLIAVVAWGRWQLASDEWKGLRWDAIWSLFYGANWHFIESGQSYFTTEPSMLRHMWSLAIEEQFYVLWPLIVLVCLALVRGRRIALAVFCILGTLASVAIMAATFTPGEDPSRSYYGTDARASQLLIGALLAIALDRRPPQSSSARRTVQVLGVLGTAVVVWMFWAAGDQSTPMYRGGFILFAVAAAAVIAAVVQSERTPLRAAFSISPAVWIGQVSYGLYLWHWPVAVALRKTRMRRWGWEVTGLWLTVLRLAATFGIATVSYYLLERPIRHQKIKWGRLRLAVAPLGFVVVLAVIVAGTAGATTNLLRQAPGSVIRSGPASTVSTAPPTTTSVSALPTETSDPTSTASTTTTLPIPPRRVLLLGDSVAASISDALTAAASNEGIELTVIARLGCGMTTGINVADNGDVIATTRTCAEEAVAYQTGALDEVHPDTALWLSTWELSHFEVDGQRLDFATPEWERWMLGELDRVRNEITSRGVRFVLVNNPTLSPNPARPVTQQDVDRYRYLNDLYARYAASTGTGLLDLAEIVCPGGPPCPVEIDGVVPRPIDGGHYDEAGAEWVAPRLLDALTATLRTMAGG